MLNPGYVKKSCGLFPTAIVPPTHACGALFPFLKTNLSY